MNLDLILASSSQIRAKMLEATGLRIEIAPARIDEATIKDALLAEDAKPRDIADALAEAKARKVASKMPGQLVLGCDQVLECDGILYDKPQSRAEAEAHLRALRGNTHRLLSAAVLYEDETPIWRHVSSARLTMRSFSDTFLQTYLDENWPSVQTSVGAYKLEDRGPRLFAQIQGDHFTILGLPLLELLNYLALKGTIQA